MGFHSFLVFLMVLAVGLTGCQKSDKDSTKEKDSRTSNQTEERQKKFTFSANEPEVILGQTAVSSTGATLKVRGPNLDGLEIQIPKESYSDERACSVAAATVNKHNLPSQVVVLSPLIQIRTGGGYSRYPIVVTVPVQLPPNHMAMAFFYNTSSGKLEGLPLLQASENKIRFATRHFDEVSQPPHGDQQTKSNGQRDLSEAAKLAESTPHATQVIILSAAESLLKQQSVIVTGFSPGVDDWEFTNFGSFLAPGGHCAGQSISAMWYFFERKLFGAPSLYHSMDTLQKNKLTLWQDNPLGYKFASVVQDEIKWDTKIYDLFEKIETTPDFHFLSWNAFALSMFITGEPQFVGLTSEKGGGHAIVAYKINLTDKILYVADPNYPGEERKITFGDTRFLPYTTKQNGSEKNEKLYPGVGYYAKSSLIDWNKISDQWQAVQNKTIGHGKFPDYQLWVIDESGYPLSNTLNTDLEKLIVEARCSSCPTGLKDHPTLQYVQVFDTEGVLLASTQPNGRLELTLKPGLNRLGFYISTPTNGDWTFLDFKWIEVTYQSVDIDPVALKGDHGTPYSWTAKMLEPPKVGRYVWSFGDGVTQTVTSSGAPAAVTHTYALDGTYEIGLEVFDASKTPNVLVATARAQATIGQDMVSRIKSSKKVFAMLTAKITFTNNSTAEMLGWSSVINSSDAQMRWTKNEYQAMNLQHDAPFAGFLSTSSFIGSIDDAGKTLLTTNARTQVASQEGNNVTQTMLVIKNLPIAELGIVKNRIGVELVGPEIKKYVTEVWYQANFKDLDNHDVEVKIKKIDWDTAKFSFTFF